MPSTTQKQTQKAMMEGLEQVHQEEKVLQVQADQYAMQQLDPKAQMKPAIHKLIAELGDNDILIDGCLNWVKKAKNRIALATIQATRTPEEFEKLMEGREPIT